MKQRFSASWIRAAGSALLLGVLAACGFLGADRKTPDQVSVPVYVHYQSAEEISQASAKEIENTLRLRREEELGLLDSVIDNSLASAETRQRALDQKQQIVLRMEQEAQTQAALAYAGYPDVSVLSGRESMNVFASYAYMADEGERIRIIDCVCTQTGILPGDVKIILAKNE